MFARRDCLGFYRERHSDGAADGIVDLAIIRRGDVGLNVPLVAPGRDVVDLQAAREAILAELPRSYQREVQRRHRRQPPGSIAGPDKVLELIDGRPRKASAPLVDR